MVKNVVDVMIEGGKATAAPPLGPALGPMGVNIGKVVADINAKTADYKGMQVPVAVTIDSETKEYTISIGTPPASALIKQEAGIKKAAANPLTEKVADLKIEQILKISNMKADAMLGKDAKSRAKEIIGTCQSMGILVEGKPASETLKDISAGKFDAKILSGKTELSAEELKTLDEERKKLKAEMEKNRAKFEAEAKAILNKHKGKENKMIRKLMVEAGIPEGIINEVAPDEDKKKKK